MAGWALAGIMIMLTAAPAAAQGDWLFTPFIGKTFAGSAALPVPDQGASASQWLIGGAAGWWSHSIIGLEADFGYAPRFFERSTQALVTNSNMMTLSLDVVATPPLSVTRDSLRPYLIGGAGWMHVSIDDSLGILPGILPDLVARTRNSVAMNFGGGAIGFVSPRTGVRFELRHFRSFGRDANLAGEQTPLLSFWRATVGVVIRR